MDSSAMSIVHIEHDKSTGKVYQSMSCSNFQMSQMKNKLMLRAFPCMTSPTEFVRTFLFLRD